MHRQFDISPEEAKRAKWPHEIFLINLIFNHIFVFAATVGVMSTFPLLPLAVPAISFAIIAYILLKARQVAAGDDSWFVKAHWQIAARRNRFFMLLLALVCIIFGAGLWLSKMLGWAKIPTIALIGGVGLLPFMVALLVLIVLGNESVYMARDGKLTERFVAQNPDDSRRS
ncbi:MAG: hypothetical protein K2P67_04740 [Gallionellaceae bacterium]|nr:hypothetical protein [Gallionellaceae bacterium]